MAPFLRKVKTASGATVVQIGEKRRGVRTILEHLGSARTEAELAALIRAGQEKLNAGQTALDLGTEREPDPAKATVQSSASRLLVDVVRSAYGTLGFEAVADEAFFQLVLARLVEPTSKADSIRVIEELGIAPVHRNTYMNALKRCGNNDYRDLVARACFAHSVSTTGISLLLYDVTTLYFEAEKEDDYRKVGYSKERRVDPQIVVGLLVDRAGFPPVPHRQARRACLGPGEEHGPVAGGLAVPAETFTAGPTTLNQQRNRALAIIEGQSRPKNARFVRTTGNTRSFDEAGYERATNLAGWKGYVSNIPASTMSAAEMVSSYHDLWHVEQSFRMSKSDLAARPIFHRTRDAIDAHLTIVFTALAIARYLQDKTGLSLKKIITLLKPLREVTISVGGHQLTADPQIPEKVQQLLETLGH